jgi:predicted NACHT family NTPase
MKTLKEQIAEFEQEKAKKIPKNFLDTMNTSILGLKSTGIEASCLKTGDTAPNFTLINHNKEKRSLADYLKTSSVVLNFYRGGW